MENKCNTLLDKLVSLVSDEHIDEVKAIVSALTKIDNFKYAIDNNEPIESLYKKIAYELQIEFEIADFEILLFSNNIENELYCFGKKIKKPYRLEYKVSDESYMQVVLPKKTLEDDFKRLSLNSYFEGIIHILYLHYILKDIQVSSYVDPLTNLTNRISFQEEMKTFVPLAIRENMNIGAILINIDRFRAVNDEHGDEFGDQFLIEYANMIKKTIRISDMAIRFGGGEFLVLLINVDTEDRTLEIAQRLKENLSDTYIETVNGDKFKKSVCIGVSMFPEDSADIHEVVKYCEAALSDAQDKGRGVIQRYEKDEGDFIDFF
jgi:diguanylate cyclase (GGDEF)-like protein